MKHLIILFCLSGLLAHSQQLLPPIVIDGSQPWSSGTIRLSNAETFIYQNSATNTSDVELKAAAEIVMEPGAVAGGYTGEGQFRAAINPQVISVVSFHPNGWQNIPRYEKFEMGVKLPASIQSQIDAFLSGQAGINPYDPEQIKVECNFNSGAYFRYGFYYRDYYVQNNTWIEKPTDYTFRIRIAPEQLYGNRADIKLFVNGVLIESVTRYFNLQNSNNPGHLKMANGNLLKMQYDNGNIFFGIGQNVAYPIPENVYGNCHAGDCNSPYTFQKQREYLADLAANGGNFTRVRLDALNMLCEWPYRQELNTDPAPTNKPLSSYLANYHDNQRYLWEYDEAFETMENTGIKAVLCLLQDQAFSVDGAYDPNHHYTWNNNPYSTITGNNLAGCKAFFTNQQSIDTYRKWLFYVQARYGYSTSVAMWQMINETANVASTYAKKHAIEDPTFNNDVKNWVQDMKFVLQQQYPPRPVTTGYVSDTNRVNIAYNLNVWSSNSYTGYIDEDNGRFLDQDYEKRAKTLIGSNSSNNAGYFPNYKPFFWGELGIGDSANIVDRKSDRNFHNTIWSSTFTGGISNGLYWNDWEQKLGVNHRKNFQALKAFTDMIDFSQRLEPGLSKDNGVGQYKRREIHTWYFANTAKNFIAGWTKNNSANWTQDLNMLSQSERTLVILATKLNEDSIAEYTCFSTNQNPETIIENLLSNTTYRVKFYNTYDNANEMDSKTYLSSSLGRLTFRRAMYSYINDPLNPDYAFIIKPASTWRVSQNNIIEASDTLYISTADSVLLKSSFVKADNNYIFSWSGAPVEVTNNTNQIKANYSIEGTYSVELKAKGEQDTTINHRFIIVVSDKELKRELNKIVIFPNPADNFLYLYYDEETIKNPIISCIDILGKEFRLEHLGTNKFDTSTLTNGLYFVKVKNGNYEKTVKINVIH